MLFQRSSIELQVSDALFTAARGASDPLLLVLESDTFFTRLECLKAPDPLRSLSHKNGPLL